MYLYMYVCSYTCTYVVIHVSMQFYIYTTYVLCMHACIFTCIYAYTCTCCVYRVCSLKQYISDSKKHSWSMTHVFWNTDSIERVLATVKIPNNQGYITFEIHRKTNNHRHAQRDQGSNDFSHFLLDFLGGLKYEISQVSNDSGCFSPSQYRKKPCYSYVIVV